MHFVNFLVIAELLRIMPWCSHVWTFLQIIKSIW